MNAQGAVVVGLTGLARSGKDTAASVLVHSFDFERVAFADALKEGCAAMLGMPIQAMYDGDRESVMPEWGFSIRDFLQRMGTECVRLQFGEDFWIKALKARIARLQSQGYRRFVISDARFDNEAAWVRAQPYGHLIHIAREGLKKMDHVSEAGVDREPQDSMLTNNSTLEEFKAKVHRWAKEAGL